MINKLFCGKSSDTVNENIFESDGSHRFAKIDAMKYGNHRNINESLLPTEQDIKFKQNQLNRTQENQYHYSTDSNRKALNISNDSRMMEGNMARHDMNEITKGKIKYSFSNSNAFSPTPTVLSNHNNFEQYHSNSSFSQMPSGFDQPFSVNFHKEFVNQNESSILPPVGSPTTFKSSQLSIDPNKKSQIAYEEYSRLLAQNYNLKKIVEEEYLPLKRCYEKLVKDQQDRDFLISKLEWKVKQLAKQVNQGKNDHHSRN